MFDFYAVYTKPADVGHPLIATCSIRKVIKKLKKRFPEQKDIIGKYADDYGYKDLVLMAKLEELLDGIRILGFIDGYDYENIESNF